MQFLKNTCINSSIHGHFQKSVLLLLVIIVFADRQNASAQDLSNLTQTIGARSKAITSADPNPNSNEDRIKYIESGETKEIADIHGAGVIRHIWLTFNEARPNWLEAGGSARPDEMVIRMYWDDSREPAVEAPLGDFFAAGFGERLEVKSVPVQVEGGDGYNCYWPMPFAKRARITITNESKKRVRSFYYHIDYTEYDVPLKGAAYFCAQYRNEFPEKTGKDYLVLDAKGQGHYVGTVMSVRSRSPEWFGEGDAKFYVDGENKPSIQGTGTEDYFLMAWGLSETQFPYYGCNFMTSDDIGELGVRYSMYRWHVADPIYFNKSLRFEIEHKGWMSADETESGKVEGHVEREDDIATVAFWYQTGTPKRFAELPPLAKRIVPDLDFTLEVKDMMATAQATSGKMELQKGYDWTGEGQLLFRPIDNSASLDLSFNIAKEEYRGLVLRFTHAPDYGIFRIYIDGKNLSLWMDSTSGSAIGKFDFYSKDLKVKDLYLGSYRLAAGKHTIRFESEGQNQLSAGNYLGFDSIRLRERWNKKRKFLTK